MAMGITDYVAGRLSAGLKRVCLAGASALLGSCSAVELGYNNGPVIIHTWVVNRIDLYPEQSELVAMQFDGLFKWHRQNELPYLLKQLEYVQNQVASPSQILASDVRQFTEATKDSFYRTGQMAAPLMADFMLVLWPDQIDQIRSILRKSNQDYFKKYLDVTEQERHEQDFERMSERFEDWLGDLSAEQVQLIEQWAEQEGFPHEARYQRRLDIQSRFMGWVELAANRSISREDLTDQLLKSIQSLREQYPGDKLERHRERSAQLVADVLNLSSSNQRDQLKEELSDWRGSIQKLISVSN